MVESSAGRFRRLTLDLWGGLDNLAADLADPPRRKLLETWLSEKPSGVQPGIFTNSRRRFLNLDDVCDASGLPASESRSLVDRYLTDGVLRRGLALQCGHCVLFDWYEMDELGQSFMCRRCNSATLLASSAWKHASNEPAFYYDLAEVVYQALRQNARVPIAGLAALKHGSKSFLDLPEVELTDADGLTIELDLLAVVDGRIVIGEAKTGDRFHDSKQAELGWLRRFADVAAALTADEVVFATAAPAWRTLTAERIATVFGGMSAGVRLLEGL